MIDVSLAYVKQVLDQYLSTSLGIENGIVILNNLINADGSSPQKNQNKIVITLINLEYETNKQFNGGIKRYNDQALQMNPAIYFNLDILVSANFDDYSESLKLLTASIGFFQANSSFNRANNPELPEGISALKLEIENSPSAKTHNLWTALGAKYVPSIIYKIRQIGIQSGQIINSSTTIQGITSTVNP